MPAHYKFPGHIDTGAYDLPGIIPHANEIAAALHLELLVVQGTGRYLRRLPAGPWNDNYFVIIPPYATIELEHPGLCLTIDPCSIQTAM